MHVMWGLVGYSMLLMLVKTKAAVKMTQRAWCNVSGIKANLVLCCYANPQDNDYLQGNVATVINMAQECLN